MIKIKESIKKKPINLVLVILVLILYVSNNAVFKNIESPIMQYFFVCHFNDLICPLLLLGYSNILLITIKLELKKLLNILLFCSVASFVWEFVAPFFKKSSITDYIDILCYIGGGFIYWLILEIDSYFKAKGERLYDRN